MMERAKILLQWIWKTLYYLVILVALVAMYASVDKSPQADFIYNGF